jgi:uncharacterized GH25 family protein
MIVKNTYFLLLIFCLIGCKKTEVSGRVYSQHKVPFPNVNIIMSDYNSSEKYPKSSSTVTTTDENGYYYFKFNQKKNHYYRIRCESDSGKSNSFTLKYAKTNQIDLYVEY